MIIHWLTYADVSIMTGQSQSGADIWKVYSNSPSGRIAIVAEQPSTIVDKVMEVWGDTPTMADDGSPKPA